MVDNNAIREFYAAITAGDAATLRRLIAKYPECVHENPVGRSWLHHAAVHDRPEVVALLADAGIDVNVPGTKSPDGPLIEAIDKGCFKVARFLLDRGANPNQGRTLVATIMSPRPLEMAKLLVEYGADVNAWYDEPDAVPTDALSWAIKHGKHEVAEFLRSKGAVSRAEGAGPPPAPYQEVVEHFRRYYGLVKELSLREVVPSGSTPVSIHTASPTEQRDHVVLFTTGMSGRPMSVPEGTEDYRFAELLIHLPRSWPLNKKALADKNNRWPIDWLRKIANYPHKSRSWLGAPFALISNHEPPQPFSPNSGFCAILAVVMPDEASTIRCAGEQTVKLYTLYPLYREERDFALEQGAEQLLRRFDQFGWPTVVDSNRPNLASPR